MFSKHQSVWSVWICPRIRNLVQPRASSGEGGYVRAYPNLSGHVQASSGTPGQALAWQFRRIRTSSAMLGQYKVFHGKCWQKKSQNRACPGKFKHGRASSGMSKKVFYTPVTLLVYPVRYNNYINSYLSVIMKIYCTISCMNGKHIHVYRGHVGQRKLGDLSC